MSDPQKPAARPQTPPGAEPSHLRWDTSAVRSHQCALATASPTPAQIILNFGAKRGRDYHGSEVGIELLQQIGLTPMTAKHLAATLERVIAEHDRMPRGSR